MRTAASGWAAGSRVETGGWAAGSRVETGGWRIKSCVEPVMGTVASFAVHARELPDDQIQVMLAPSRAFLHHADQIFSTWNPDTPLSRLRRGEISMSEVPDEVIEVLDLCRMAKEMSDGWFDPWAMPGGVDPTGLVKGWAIDNALDLMRHPGIGGAMLNVGGDLATFGTPAPDRYWRIGIRDPWDPTRLRCVIQTGDAVATSGTYERGPILVDPHSGLAHSRAASATVVGPSLALADALATALTVAGTAGIGWFAHIDGYEAYLIHHDGTETATSGIRPAGPGWTSSVEVSSR